VRTIVLRRRIRLECVASSVEVEAAHLEKLNGKLQSRGSERRVSLHQYRKVYRLVRRADEQRFNQAVKRGGLWMAKRQAVKRIEAAVFRRLVGEGDPEPAPATPRAAAAAGEVAGVEPSEASARPRTYGAQQKKTRNRKKRERKEAKLASSGGAAGRGPSGGSTSRRKDKSWHTSGAASSNWSAASWGSESWGSSGAASSNWSAVAWGSESWAALARPCAALRGVRDGCQRHRAILEAAGRSRSGSRIRSGRPARRRRTGIERHARPALPAGRPMRGLATVRRAARVRRCARLPVSSARCRARGSRCARRLEASVRSREKGTQRARPFGPRLRMSLRLFQLLISAIG
jgi:hypothetical protein